MESHVVSRRVRRGGLLASVCAMGLMQVTPALAQEANIQDGGHIAVADPQPYAGLVSIKPGLQIEKIDPEPEILIADPGTPTTARDPVNITGIGRRGCDVQDR